jgi:hypothetical protein
MAADARVTKNITDKFSYIKALIISRDWAAWGAACMDPGWRGHFAYAGNILSITRDSALCAFSETPCLPY